MAWTLASNFVFDGSVSPDFKTLDDPAAKRVAVQVRFSHAYQDRRGALDALIAEPIAAFAAKAVKNLQPELAVVVQAKGALATAERSLASANAQLQEARQRRDQPDLVAPDAGKRILAATEEAAALEKAVKGQAMLVERLQGQVKAASSALDRAVTSTAGTFAAELQKRILQGRKEAIAELAKVANEAVERCFLHEIALGQVWVGPFLVAKIAEGILAAAR